MNIQPQPSPLTIGYWRGIPIAWWAPRLRPYRYFCQTPNQ